MKTNSLPLSVFRCLIRITPLFATAGLCAAPLTWFSGTALNEARSGAATAVAPGGAILLFGGNPFGSTNVLVYGANNAQPLNSTRVGPGAIALNASQFYVFGGRQTNAHSASSTTYSYNPVSAGPDAENPSLFTVTPMITARSDMAYTADANGYAYAIGGLGRNTNALTSVERYDPVGNVWTTNVAAMPVATYLFKAVFDGTNTIYTFGGRTNGTTGTEIATVRSYSVSANTWSTQASMPVATAGSAAVAGSDGKYYVIGGTAGGVVTNLVQVYDPAGDSWTLATPLPMAVTGTGGATDASGRLVVVGGADGNGSNLSTSWVSQPLSVADAAPVFTTPARTSANCLVPYSYAAHATGNPPPTFQLLTAPAGMQIDLYSGAVAWTPDTNELGSNVVAIVASNYAGSATQTFIINTVGPPLSPPTNLVQVAVSDTSATISWDPPAFVIGPLTYQLYRRTVFHDPKGSGGRYNYALLASGFTGNTVSISGLAVGTSYTFVVKASAAGVTSGYSSAINIATTRPQPPQNLQLTGVTSTTISLAWDPSPGPVPILYYALFDYGAGYTTTPVRGAEQITGTSVNLTGLVPGTTHLYAVFAYDAEGYASLGSLELSVVNPVPVPASLSGFGPTPGGGFQFTVQQTGWIQTTLIQATSTPGDPGSWVTIATNPPTGSTYVFTDPDAGLYSTRFYRVVSP